ncbi:hypothetical protein HD806DRAFT_484449 [Xylariaceae sp. AK1471]|nr:hypothetical protein HD806DRAFT_484449 [Xylariaceae sp. AK1471]
MTSTRSSSSSSSSSSLGWAKFPWGCTITTDKATKWPLNTTITHKSTCECKSQGGDGELVRDYLFVVAYEYYYKQDRERYNALVCNELVKAQGDRLELDLDELKIWDFELYFLCARLV